jgi:hypothetical protein
MESLVWIERATPMKQAALLLTRDSSCVVVVAVLGCTRVALRSPCFAFPSGLTVSPVSPFLSISTCQSVENEPKGQVKAVRDEIEKKNRGYTDPRSKVRPGGSEVLYGRDWTKRKQELWGRAGGICERILEMGQIWNDNGISKESVWYERCRSEGHDPHHIVKRSKKRDDRLENLQLLCRLHHDLLHGSKE